jgi:hypothetical protein
MTVRADRLPKLSIGTEWTPLEFIGEPFITVTFRGYAAAIDVRVISTGLEYTLLVGAKSLSGPLERLRAPNGGELKGLRVALRKSGEERTAAYEVRQVK